MDLDLDEQHSRLEWVTGKCQCVLKAWNINFKQKQAPSSFPPPESSGKLLIIILIRKSRKVSSWRIFYLRGEQDEHQKSLSSVCTVVKRVKFIYKFLFWHINQLLCSREVFVKFDGGSWDWSWSAAVKLNLEIVLKFLGHDKWEDLKCLNACSTFPGSDSSSCRQENCEKVFPFSGLLWSWAVC